MLIRKLAAGVALGALALAATSAYAQETTGGVAGRVTEGGKPVAGATIKVTNTGTGVTTTATTSSDGFYTVRNLPPGGPYKVAVTAPDNSSETDQIDQVPVGAAYSLDVALGSTVSEVTVTAAPLIKNLTVATGPRTTFTAASIAALPSFAGDLHDLVRLNPFVTIDEANSNSLIIAGTNNHFNTIYLDGVRQSDDFGLNNNGYPTQRSPFSLSIIQSMNLEVAPYDVQYGNFEGGILNVTTKSGSNQFHGTASYSYDSNAESGHKIGVDAIYAGIEGLKPANATDRLVTTQFKDEDSQFTFGGPLWEDHLFFFAGYDRYQGIGSSVFVPQDVAGANVVPGVAQADVTAVQNSLTNVYKYNALNFGGTAPVLNTDIFAKLDWYITEKQHLWVSYQETDGTIYNTPGASVSSKKLNLASDDYILSQNLTAYTGDLTSQWTDNFATEIEYTYRTVASPTLNVGAPFANFQIQAGATAGAAINGGSIIVGPDISRQANNLAVRDSQLRFKGHYTLGDNVITAGFEHEKLSEFDLFVQDATGAYVFNNSCGPGLGAVNGGEVNLAKGVACSLFYQNAFDNNPNTAAQTATNFTNTLYAEDEWHAAPGLTITGGLRAEFYSSPSTPLLNPRFVAQYGFANNATVNGEFIVMPRVGFNWKPDPSLTLSGGFGLFSGGNPGVYTYNSFDNTGNLVGSHSYTCAVADCSTAGSALTIAGTSALVGVTGSSIPADVQADITASAKLGTGTVNALDPNFKPPSQWKVSFSASKTIDFHDYESKWQPIGLLGDNWRLHADFIYAKTQDAVTWEDLWEEQNQLTATEAAALGVASPDGNAPDGRPLFNPNRYFCGVINPATGTCATTVVNGTIVGTPPPGTPAGTTRTSGSDLILKDTHQGDSIVWALGFDKSLPGGFDFDYTYTHQNVRDVNPATSSVASSNYTNNLTVDPNHPGLTTSNYQVLYENRINVSYRHKWLGDNATTISLFFYNRAGLPFSYAFCPTAAGSTCGVSSPGTNFDELFGQASSSTMHQLLYVPKTDQSGNVTATSDPKVTYGPAFTSANISAFNDFLHRTGLIKYAGSISPRNGFRSSDVNTGDIHLAQEVPALFPHGAKGEFYVDVINFLNLIDKNWGIDNQVGFPYVFAPVTAINCQFSGVTVLGGTKAVQMPTCAAGKGNFYQYNTFRPQVVGTTNQFSTVQSLANPPVSTWVLKFGVRYKF